MRSIVFAVTKRTGGAALLLLVGSSAAGCGGGGGANGSVTPPAPNNPPVVSSSNPQSVRAVHQHPFSLDLALAGSAFFRDPDGDTLDYSILLGGTTGGLTALRAVISGAPTHIGTVTAQISVSDRRGGTAFTALSIVIEPNAAPVVSRPNFAIMKGAGEHVNYDPTQDGAAFADPDGDALTYSIAIVSPPLGFEVQGTRVVGSLPSVGVVTFELTAQDAYLGMARQRFSIAVPAPEPARPMLPSPAFVYDDGALALPEAFEFARQHFAPLWDTAARGNPPTNAGATLGRVLFYDKRLSITNTHSCGSCHKQAHGFASAERFDTGVQGVPMKRNTMGLTNVRYNLHDKFFADMRVEKLENLVLLPIEGPSELGNYLPAVVTKLAATDFYPPLFEAAFGTSEVTSERIGLALTQFLRSILSFHSRYDVAFTHDPQTDPGTVLTLQERAGSAQFGIHCQLCHATVLQQLDRPTNNGLDAMFTDAGAGNGIFRAASLRNIAKTAPYMHDGRFNTLREVIDHYDQGVEYSTFLDIFLTDPGLQRARRMDLTEEQKLAIEAFLHTLTDDTLLADPRFSDPFAP